MCYYVYEINIIPTCTINSHKIKMSKVVYGKPLSDVSPVE